MKIFCLALLIVVTVEVKSSDPGHCQRVIKYMLIKACGETKRENLLNSLPVMSDFEIERRYSQMIKGNVVRGLRYEDVLDFETNYNSLETNHIDDTKADDGKPDPLLFLARERPRFRRSMIRPIFGFSHTRHITDPHVHEKVGSMSFIESMLPSTKGQAPVPPGLKVQCCAPRVCSMEHFRAFCEVD